MAKLQSIETVENGVRELYVQMKASVHMCQVLCWHLCGWDCLCARNKTTSNLVHHGRYVTWSSACYDVCSCHYTHAHGHTHTHTHTHTHHMRTHHCTQDRLAEGGTPTPEMLAAEKEALANENILVVLGALHAQLKNLWAFKVSV